MALRAGWSLAVHGGAKTIAPGEAEANRSGCRAALAAGRAVLERGGCALDAVEQAVRALESDPTFNAGFGSELNEAGQVEMCAAVMSGRDLGVGAVSIVQGLRHPISVARLLLDEPWVLLAGEGAHDFARKRGAELCDPAEFVARAHREPAEAHDTVGAVARDMGGDLAVATSTGGLPGAPVGRVADSSLPGCGYYANNHVGALSLSGDGESIARCASASQVMQAMPAEGPEAALEKALSRLTHLGGDGGGIAIDKDGRIGWWHNSPHFAVAVASSDDPEGEVWLSKDER
jgi:beta-aspartyl-peptidase (threonine type)